MTNMLQRTSAPSWLSQSDCTAASIEGMPEAKRFFVIKGTAFVKAVADCKRMGGTRRFEMNISLLENYLWAINYLHKIRKHICRNYGVMESDMHLTDVYSRVAEYNKTATLEYTNAFGATVSFTINYRQ